MTAARRRQALQISGAVAALGLVLGAYGHLRLAEMLDAAHYNANGVLLESAAWQSDFLGHAVVLAIGGALVMAGGLGLMLVVTWKLRFPEAVLIGITAGIPFTDAARTFAPQLAGDFGRPRDVTDTVINLLVWVGLIGILVAAVVLVAGIVGAVRATSAPAAPAMAPPPA
jgi:hypothetical protein